MGLILNLLAAVLFLTGYAFSHAFNFYLLAGRRIPLAKVCRLVFCASALNKLLFTGSGFLAASRLGRDETETKSSQILAVFVLLELLSVSGWLAAGIFFGARMAKGAPLILAVFLAIVLAALWFKLRPKKGDAGSPSWKDSFKTAPRYVLLVMPLIVINAFLFAAYYFFFFRAFGAALSLLATIKIVAVSFTAGYLSPAPSGLGFKDAGLAALLVAAGLSPGLAITLAVVDRLLVSIFWVFLGGGSAIELAKQEFRRRTKKNG